MRFGVRTFWHLVPLFLIFPGKRISFFGTLFDGSSPAILFVINGRE
jgi:hypothetical protein